MAFDPHAQAAQVTQAKTTQTTLEQRIAQKEAELSRLKERKRASRNKKLILLGIVAEKSIKNDEQFKAYFADAAQRYLSASDLKKVTNRYGGLDV